MISNQEPPVKIRLLGSFEVSRGDRVIRAENWTRKKAASLLKRLALEHRLLKDQAIEFLWPEIDPASAANNLYKTLHVLRRTLDAALGPGTSESVVRYEDGVLSLLPSVWVDTHEFDRLCGRLTAAPRVQQIANLEQALALYQGDLLPDDLYEEWTQLHRETFYRSQREARLALALHQSGARDYASAIALLQPLLAHDPADEPVHRELASAIWRCASIRCAWRRSPPKLVRLLRRKPMTCIPKFSITSLRRLSHWSSRPQSALHLLHYSNLIRSSSAGSGS
jgi:DNA-binding SARP family transcriptional activator